MRRRLVLLSGAIAAMIVLAFVIPLGFLVRDLARDRALSEAERNAQTVAQNLLLVDATDVERVALVLDVVAARSEERLSVVMPDDTVLGDPTAIDENILGARAGESITTSASGGAVVVVPVARVAQTPLVVQSFVPSSVLRRNVIPVLFLLAGLGAVLVLIAMAVADRMGRSLVEPVRDLSEAAAAVTAGDLTVRVDPDGPPEIVEVGSAFNRLVERIGALLSSERESVADLAHRLRTPLTALRLNVESLDDPAAARRLGGDIDELERTVDFVIEEARRPVREGVGTSTDLGEVARERATFWGALAEEQDRAWDVVVEPGTHAVRAHTRDVAAALDALIGNVFDHTDAGVGFAVEVATGAGGVQLLAVRDTGPGLSDGSLVERGTSTRSSTGLGLDIARRTAEAAGGGMILGRAPGGGAEVVLEFDPV